MTLESPLDSESYQAASDIFNQSTSLSTNNNSTPPYNGFSKILTLQRMMNCQTLEEWTYITKFMETRKYCCGLVKIKPKPWFSTDDIDLQHRKNQLKSIEEDRRTASCENIRNRNSNSKISSSKIFTPNSLTNYYELRSFQYQTTFRLRPILDPKQLKTLRLVYILSWALLSSGMIIICLIFHIMKYHEWKSHQEEIQSGEANYTQWLNSKTPTDGMLTINLFMTTMSIIFSSIFGAEIFIEFEEALSYAEQFRVLRYKLMEKSRDGQGLAIIEESHNHDQNNNNNLQSKNNTMMSELSLRFLWVF